MDKRFDGRPTFKLYNDYDKKITLQQFETDGENTKERLTRYQLAYFNKNQLFLFNNQKNA